MSIPQAYDVIVVGAGSMGMSAGYFLAKKGLKTLLIDAFDPPHTEGSHHGDSRLIRHAYTGHETYSLMAVRAHKLWNELEEATGKSLLVQSGVLNMAPSNYFALDQKLENAERFKLPIEILKSADIRKRWPGINLPEEYVGLYEKEAGYLHSDECIRAYRTLAIEAGAVLLPFTRVEDIDIQPNGVSIQTNAGRFHADQVVLSAGAWFETLNKVIKLPIRAVRKTVAWFEADEALFDLKHFPGFTLGAGAGGFFGFPSVNGSGVKIGRHDTGVEWKPGDIVLPFGSYPEDEGDLRAALEAFMPRAAGKLLKSVVCKYEFSPDDNFIIDRHPDHGNVIVAGGFSGHGFKFSSVVGEILSELVVDQRTSHDISPFSLSRFDKDLLIAK